MRVLSINSEEHWSTFGEKTTERATRDYCNDDDELERVRDPDETKTIVVALVFVVKTRRDDLDDDDDDAKRTRTRETCKTTSSGENKDESEA